MALERWIRIKSGGEEMLNTFLTFSLPDQHLDDLHRLLPGHEAYLGKTVLDNLEDVPADADPADFIDKKTDFNLRMKAVADNGHIGKCSIKTLNLGHRLRHQLFFFSQLRLFVFLQHLNCIVV